MRIGLGLSEFSGGRPNLDEAVDEFVRAEAEGFETGWVAQIFGLDALTVLALAATRTTSIKLGTAVVPIWTRHPLVMAQQAITTNVLAGGRLRLGLGLLHKPVLEAMYGIPFEKPAQHMEEYLNVVTSLVNNGSVATMGAEFYKVMGSVSVDEATPFPVYVAALGPRLLRIAGELANGTVTWMTGMKTIESHVAPAITAAAEAAGRENPEVLVGLPVAVTEDVEEARARASKIFAVYPNLPSYKAMLDREGISDASELIVAGSEDAVEAALNAYVDAGATELVLLPVGVGETSDARAESVARTRQLLVRLAAD